MTNWQLWVGAAAAGVITLGVGGLLTEIGPWYKSLRKPSWQPPNWLFAPAWTLIMGFATWAGVLAWREAPGAAERGMVMALFVLNSLLNMGWSLFFFKWRRPDWALIEVVPLWVSVLFMIIELGSYSTRGAWLLVPYLVWVGFAAFLNWTIVRLNGRFAGA